MSSAPRPIVTAAPPAAANDADSREQIRDPLPSVILTPELEAGLLALAPLLDLLRARERARRSIRRAAPALPPRPEVTPEMKKAIERSLKGKGYR